MVARMTIEGNAAIYRAALDSANAGDLAGYLDLYSDDVVFGGVSRSTRPASSPPGA
jgi:ketosteroid isomerase-like protein